MSSLLFDDVVVVTGSSSGIGRAIAIESARHGAKLVLHHIGDAQAVQDIPSLKAEIETIRGGPKHENAGDLMQAIDIGIDITRPEAGQKIVDGAVSAFGEINVLIHNAGIAQFEEFAQFSRSQLDRHLNINFGGPIFLSQAVVQQMIAQSKGGSVVSIASVTATFGSSQLTHYAATKAAVLVSPGNIETAMNSKDLAGPKRGQMESRVPLGRLIRPEDIAEPVVFMSSKMAGYTTGQNLIVDGGATLNYQ